MLRKTFNERCIGEAFINELNPDFMCISLSELHLTGEQAISVKNYIYFAIQQKVAHKRHRGHIVE